VKASPNTIWDTHLFAWHKLFAPISQLGLEAFIDLRELGVLMLHKGLAFLILQLLQFSVNACEINIKGSLRWIQSLPYGAFTCGA